MATFNQTQQKYYTTTWGNNTPNRQTVPFGTTTLNNQQTNWFTPTTSNQWNTPNRPFGSTNLEAPKQPLFGSTNLEAPKQPLFGSTNFATKIEAPKFFGSTVETPKQLFQPQPLFGSTNLEAPKQPLFGSTNLEAPKQPLLSYYNVASNLTLLPLNLPKNKIEGLIFMVSLDQQNTIANTETLLDNVFNQTKFSSNNLWFTSLIKYSDEKFALQKIDENHISFALLYSTLLRELMVESIRTPQELYTWLINFAKTNKNKKMLWLFTILKFAEKNQFEDILDMSNNIEVFVWALQTFIQYDNDPANVTTLALQSTNNLYKTFLLSMIGASYGKEFYTSVETNNNLSDLVTKFK
jgi:hypothetical protein